MTWRYKAYGQRGYRGFFGTYDVDKGAGDDIYLFPRKFGDADDYDWTAQPGDFAGYNGWLGPQVGGISSGSDASGQTMFADLLMTFKVNSAIEVNGAYRIGSYKNQFIEDRHSTYDFRGPDFRDEHGTQLFRKYALPDQASAEYLAGQYPGSQKAFSPGYWRSLWAKINLPWGNLTLGKSPFTFGAGLMIDGSDNSSIEALILGAPYGPMEFGLIWSPFRRGSEVYYNPFDNNGKTAWDVGAFATYAAGPVSFGILTQYNSFHIGPEGARAQNVVDEEILDVPYRQIIQFEDTSAFYGVLFTKYNNGRFFFNSELDWYNQITTSNIATDTSTLDEEYLLRLPGYIEHWRFMTELGFFAGATKTSFLYAWVSGPDIRHGIQIDRTGAMPIQWLRNLPGEDFYQYYQWIDTLGAYRILPTTRFTNTRLFKPYSLVMVYNYGLGTDVNPDTGDGWVQDASCFGARLDYAVAANLNLFGSFFTAQRSSKSGYTWGYIRPSQEMDGSVDLGNRAPWDGDYFNEPINTVPDSDLGWEVDLGFNWKLLEGLTVDATLGYWKPGKWFKYACIDRSIPDWGEPDDAEVFFGVMPNRTIDSIWGMEMDCIIEF